MATIKYEINGKANTKPFTDTSKSAQGLFESIKKIDNKMNAFVGIKVFQTLNKTIKSSIDRYDDFKKKIGEELPVNKQMERLKNSIAATLGTVRDSVFNMFSSGNNSLIGGFSNLVENMIPKFGAALVASLKVAETIVKNIKNNFSDLLKPETWNDFFSHASKLGTAFVSLLSNLLKDGFNNAVKFFGWAFNNIDISKFFQNVLDGFGIIGDIFGFALKVSDKLNVLNLFKDKSKQGEPMPALQQSSETKKAFGEFTRELGTTFKSALDTLAGTDTTALYNSTYTETLNRLNSTLERMNAPESSFNPADFLSKISSEDIFNNFKTAREEVNKLFDGITEKQADVLSRQLSNIDTQYNKAKDNIDKYTTLLKEATNPKDAEKYFNSITTELNKIGEATNTISSIKIPETATKTTSFIERFSSAIGELGQVMEAMMTKNWIGLIITLIARLAGTFGEISKNAKTAENILTYLFDIIGDIIADLGPALDELFLPLLVFVKEIGQIIGVLLHHIIPIIAAVTRIVDQLGFVNPILNAFGYILAWLTDVIGYVYNFVSDAISALTLGLVDMGKISTDNLKRLEESDMIDYTKDDYADNSASYNVSGDMYINIYYEHSYVNGDAEQIALSLRDEIRRAEGMGY
jgi:hypothetical protein